MILDPQATFRRLFGTVQDITDRRHSQAQLLLRDRAIDSATDGVRITDPSRPGNPVVHVNHGFERMTGFARAEVLGRSMRFLQGPQTDPSALTALREAVAEGRTHQAEILNYRNQLVAPRSFNARVFQALKVGPDR